MDPIESFIKNHVYQRSQKEYQTLFDSIKSEDYEKLKPVYLSFIQSPIGFGSQLKEIFAETVELFKNKQFVELFKSETLQENPSLMQEKASLVGSLIKKIFDENSEKDLSAIEMMGPLVYITPVKDLGISPIEKVLPTTMEAFVKDLEEKPLETYLSLVNQVYRFGEDFPFPPYKELMIKIASYLHRKKESSFIVKDFLNDIQKEIDAGVKFTTSIRLIQKFINLFPNNSKGVNGLLDEINVAAYLNSRIDPVQFREEDGVIVFRFACDKELSLMYFVNTRGVPVFPLALGADEDLNPTSYDQDHTPDSRYSFWNHDEQHTDILLMQESKYRLLNFLEDIIKTRDVYKSIKNRFYSFKFYEALLKKIHNTLLQVQDNDLKKALEALLFYLLHEDEGGAYPLDPDFINRHFIVMSEMGFLNQFSYLKNEPLKSCQEGKGLEAALLHAKEKLSSRLKEYAYPKEYQINNVIHKLGEAAELLFKLLNEERVSQIGEFFSFDPEERRIHSEIQLAALNLPKERYFRLFPF
jgi:hypothetical protein